jgi:hypothetical protein
VALALGLLLFAADGCSTKPNIAKNATYPAPYVVGTEEIMQRDAARARERELVKAGKSPDEARRTAEKEYPAPPPDSDSSLQSPDYYQQQKQKATQEKFESDLDKLKEKS